MRRTMLVGCAVLLAAIQAGQAGGEIFGTITTSDGQTLRGPIRWDKNEIFWDDPLDAMRREPIVRDENEREFSISIFGMRLGGEPERFTSHGLSIPFGHLRALEPVSAHEARLMLKSGKELVVSSGLTDIGEGLREVLIDDPEHGQVSLRWGAIRRVEFGPGPGPGRDAERLYGKVVTADGAVQGFIVFGRDEALAGDLLTGRVAGEARQVRLGDVSVLTPAGGEGARLEFGAGREALALDELSGGRGRRTLTVSVAGVGLVEIDWDDIRRVEFAKPPASPRYDAFDGGHPLTGTVYPRSGAPVAGTITWDRDESSTYDAVDGHLGDLDYAIPFANIRVIRRKSSRASEVVLNGGASLELSGTNDVDDDNRGVIVRRADGTTRELDWEEVDRVELQPPAPPAPPVAPGR